MQIVLNFNFDSMRIQIIEMPTEDRINTEQIEKSYKQNWYAWLRLLFMLIQWAAVEIYKMHIVHCTFLMCDTRLGLHPTFKLLYKPQQIDRSFSFSSFFSPFASSINWSAVNLRFAYNRLVLTTIFHYYLLISSIR